MHLYRLYDLPNWLFGLITVVALTVPSVAGLFAVKPSLRRLGMDRKNVNDLISYYFAAIGVFYGLALGLIAVATYQNFSSADSEVAKEASSLASLYRDLDFYPDPLRGELEYHLKDYISFIIEKEWPAHHEGQESSGGEELLEKFENLLMEFEPVKEREKIAQAEAIRSLGSVTQGRATRLRMVNSSLPGVLWSVILIGAAINIGITYLFVVDSLRVHAVLVASFSTSLALLIFLTAAMDNPFRGQFSVTSEAYESVLHDVIEKDFHWHSTSKPASRPDATANRADPEKKAGEPARLKDGL